MELRARGRNTTCRIALCCHYSRWHIVLQADVGQIAKCWLPTLPISRIKYLAWPSRELLASTVTRAGGSWVSYVWKVLCLMKLISQNGPSVNASVTSNSNSWSKSWTKNESRNITNGHAEHLITLLKANEVWPHIWWCGNQACWSRCNGDAVDCTPLINETPVQLIWVDAGTAKQRNYIHIWARHTTHFPCR